MICPFVSFFFRKTPFFLESASLELPPITYISWLSPFNIIYFKGYLLVHMSLRTLAPCDIDWVDVSSVQK